MPIVANIEEADALDAGRAHRLISAIRASATYQESAFYSDLESTVRARIQKRAAVTGASIASPIVITVSSHPFSDGDIVSVSGVGGNDAANGSWVVANQTATTFELVGSIGLVAYTSGGLVQDYVSQHLSAVVTALDEVGDGTFAINKANKDGIDISDVRDRESLIEEALAALYNIEGTASGVIVGQRCESICYHCHWPLTSYGSCANPGCHPYFCF